MPSRDPHHLQGVAGVGAVPVEEVLRVEEHPLALGGQVPHGVGDHGEVLGQGGPQRCGDVPVVALGDQRHHRRAGLAQRRHLRVVGGDRARPPGGPERREGSVAELELGARPAEELGVLGDGTRPAAFDEADAELVQAPCDGQLVGDRQAEAFLLGAIAQRGVVDVETVVGHLMSFSNRTALAGQNKRPLAGCERSARRRVRPCGIGAC